MEPHADSDSPSSRARPGVSVNGSLVTMLAILVLVLVYRDFTRQERLVVARGDLAADETATIDLFKRIAPSVVHVDNVAQGFDWRSLNAVDVQRGSASGFVWDKSGHVVTNYHVIHDADKAWVTLADNTRLEAELVGFDESKDLAVLKVVCPADRLQPIPLGTSFDLEVGQKVFAIGSPFELDQTLTTGIIGGLGREIESLSGRPIQGVIQTDAAINPGNSGGPLLDSAGRLIGVTTAIKSPSGGSVGIGFAVPVDTVQRVVPQLITTGKVKRPGLGIRTLDDRRTSLLPLKKRGVVIDQVNPNSAAEKVGLRGIDWERQVVGDVILKIDDDDVRNQNDLYRSLDRHDVGDTVRITVWRDEKELEVNVTLQAIPTAAAP
ncbi:MAG: PDZ domain-containing protein [Planctomycetota bacterium]|nr:MAG: PDZ domain-containing protein [Planctomycetota bacterium]GDY09009.1 2-alkenal reductase [Planctomycetia bacterium]